MSASNKTEKNSPEDSGALTNLTLITGGARSGKSAFAEAMAESLGGHVVYIATMTFGVADGESAARINKHKSRRPAHWQTIEEPLDLAETIAALSDGTRVCLIDCLSLWLANLLPVLEESSCESELGAIEKMIDLRGQELLRAIGSKPNIQFVIVTNEVGSGIVPTNLVARLYRDWLGILNQSTARAAGRVWLCCVGLQLALKT